MIHTQSLFIATGDRIKKTYSLNKAAIARIAAVANGQMIKRTLLGATTRE
jgi:hypothetical protein